MLAQEAERQRVAAAEAEKKRLADAVRFAVAWGVLTPTVVVVVVVVSARGCRVVVGWLVGWLVG